MHVRRAGSDCANQADLVTGRSLLARIIRNDDTGGLGRSVENAKGNIESCRLYFGLSSAHPGSEVAAARIDNALAHYARAAEDEPPCSFADQRRRNNTLDLKLKLAMFRDSPRMAQARIGDPKSWLDTPDDQAADLEQEAAGLLRCNSTAPLSPLRWTTVSEAFGVAARLRELWSKQERADLRAAGTYLALAHSYSPADIHDWNLRAYCEAVAPRQTRQGSRRAQKVPDQLRHRAGVPPFDPTGRSAMAAQ